MTAIEQLLAKLPDARKTSKGWSACCPAHADRSPSLSISEGDDGRVLVHCHAGCTVDAVCAELGLQLRDLMPIGNALTKPEKSARNGKPKIVAEYDYQDVAGNLLYQVVRYEPKDFRQRRPKAGGGWEWSVTGSRVVPYRLPELLAEPGRPVVVVEGEKDADTLIRIGVLATCNAGGAEKWAAQHAEFLRGQRVLVLPDNDDVGRQHAQQVAATLYGVAESVHILELPGLPPKGDVSDWIAAGGTREELRRLAQAAPAWAPAAAPDPWPEIVGFDASDLPEFPTSALPAALRNWVEAESLATQTPADLAGLLVLAACSAAIARRVEVEPRPGWREPVNLFVAVLLESGNRKSAVFNDALRPLKEVEAGLIEYERPGVARKHSERRQAEARLRKLEKLAAEKNDAAAREEAGKLAAELAEQPEPALPRLIVDDSTSEKLGIMLAEQDGRIASMSPEGGVFDLMAGLYSKSGIPQFGVYLMGHSGDDLITDRVSRKSIRVERPALTCAYAIQPQVIEGLAENTAFRGRGLLARFLYAAPRSWIGRRQIAPPPVSGGMWTAYEQAVQDLVASFGNCGSASQPIQLQLTPDALRVFQAWESEVETMLADGGQMEMTRDWGGKLAGATLRLAAVLHCVEHGAAGYIGRTTIAAAVEIARYLVPHAETVLNMMQAKEGSGDDDARYVLRWIERHSRSEFTKTEVQHHGKRRFPKADDIDPALAELTRRSYIRSRPSEATGPGRPPSPRYEVNPAAFADANAKKRSHNSQNSADEPPVLPEGLGFGNIGSALEESENANRVQVTI